LTVFILPEPRNFVKTDSSHLSTEEAKTSSDILKAFLQDLFRSERVAGNPLAAICRVVVFISFFFFLSFSCASFVSPPHHRNGVWWKMNTSMVWLEINRKKAFGGK